jgi:hypothetical protein
MRSTPLPTFEVGDRARRVGGSFDGVIGDVLEVSDLYDDTYLVRFPLTAGGVTRLGTVDRLLHATNLAAVA